MPSLKALHRTPTFRQYALPLSIISKRPCSVPNRTEIREQIDAKFGIIYCRRYRVTAMFDGGQIVEWHMGEFVNLRNFITGRTQ